jgi:hypothetical protein
MCGEKFSLFTFFFLLTIYELERIRITKLMYNQKNEMQIIKIMSILKLVICVFCFTLLHKYMLTPFSTE